MKRAGAPRGEPPATEQEVVELCAFRVGGEEYVVDLRRVREVSKPVGIRPVPRAPEFIEGVADLRGEIVPVVDVRRRLGLAAGPAERSTRFLVVHVGRRVVALVVDAVLEVMRVPRGSIRPASGLAGPDAPRLFLGVCGGFERRGAAASSRGRLRLLLDVRALLEPSGPREIEAARDLLREAEGA